MRILAVNWQDLTNPQAGGAEVHFEEILSRVVQWGHHVTLACSNYPGGRAEEEINGIRIVRSGNRYNFNFVAMRMITRLLDREPYDVVVEDINKIPFYLPLFIDRPHLAVIPHLFGKNIYQEANAVIASYVYLAEKPIPRVYRNSRFLAISQSTREDLIARGIRSERVAVSECGVDHSVYRPDPASRRYERPTILYLGRLKKYKSVQHMIEALPLIRQAVPTVRALIVGDGDHLPALRELTERLGQSDAVEFTGFVTLESKLEYLRRSHLSIYPSPKEGWGITNIEANACGTPVVAANVPGLRDSVSDGVSGLLYEYGNIRQLADQVIELLSNSVRHQQMSEGGINWAAKFTWERCARESFAEIERSAAEGARRG